MLVFWHPETSSLTGSPHLLFVFISSGWWLNYVLETHSWSFLYNKSLQPPRSRPIGINLDCCLLFCFVKLVVEWSSTRSVELIRGAHTYYHDQYEPATTLRGTSCRVSLESDWHFMLVIYHARFATCGKNKEHLAHGMCHFHWLHMMHWDMEGLNESTGTVGLKSKSLTRTEPPSNIESQRSDKHNQRDKIKKENIQQSQVTTKLQQKD